jgi:hypothetical protein
MNLHLKEISTQVTPGACAALVCDGAGGTVSPSLPPADRFAMASARRRPRTAGQHHYDNLAALRTRVEPDGECLGILASEQTLRPGLERLRCDRRSLQECLALSD